MNNLLEKDRKIIIVKGFCCFASTRGEIGNDTELDREDRCWHQERVIAKGCAAWYG